MVRKPTHGVEEVFKIPESDLRTMSEGSVYRLQWYWYSSFKDPFKTFILFFVALSLRIRRPVFI
jgi:hypothetical protein